MKSKQSYNHKTFEGILVPLVTPLDKDERIIEDDLVRHVRYLLDAGIHGFMVPSGTGEFCSLSFDQRRRLVEIVATEVKGRVPVLPLTSDCGTRNALKLIEAAGEAGATGVMVTPPYYVPVDQETLKRFFTTLANEGGLPLWFYHQPAHTKIEIEPKTVAELAENENIVGIKASPWKDLLYFEELLRVLRGNPDFRVLLGEDHYLLSGLILGGHGSVGTLANLIPETFVAMWKAIKGQKIDEARQLQNKIMDVTECIFAFPQWQGAVKWILQKRGILSSTVCAEPCPILTSEQQKQLEIKGHALGLF